MLPQPRRVLDLLQAKESERFAGIAEGLALMASNIAELEADVEVLTAAGRYRAAAILGGYADEEAAKVFILLDFVRIGWGGPPTIVANTAAGAFKSHLQRGPYVFAYEGSPASFDEVKGLVDPERASHFLDGPTGVDWVFRNMLEERREHLLYVDYVLTDEGPRWDDPTEHWPGLVPGRLRSRIVDLALLMARVGLLSTTALEATRSACYGVTIDLATHWTEVAELNATVVNTFFGRAEPSKDRDRDAAQIVDRWTFPLLSLDLKQQKVTTAQI